MQYRVIVDVDLPDEIPEMMNNRCELHILAQGDVSDEAFASAQGLLTYGHPIIDGAFMDRLPNLKIISNFGVGVDHIDLSAAKQRGIPVGNTPDMTFAMLMAAARNIVIGDRFARSAAFTHYDPRILIGHEIHSTTLGIIGMGNIGRQVARRAQGFDMNVLYHNRKPDPKSEAELGATYVSLNDLLEQSDFVTLNVPLTEETRNMIGRNQLRRMKRTAILVNLARGGVIDHDALVEALENNWIAVAALDVTEPEPLPRDHLLLSMDNVVIVPHLGSATRQTRIAMAQRTVDNLIAGLTDQPLITRVV